MCRLRIFKCLKRPAKLLKPCEVVEIGTHLPCCPFKMLFRGPGMLCKHTIGYKCIAGKLGSISYFDNCIFYFYFAIIFLCSNNFVVSALLILKNWSVVLYAVCLLYRALSCISDTLFRIKILDSISYLYRLIAIKYSSSQA